MLHGLLARQKPSVAYQDMLGFATQLAGLKVQRDGFDRLGKDVFRETNKALPCMLDKSGPEPSGQRRTP